MHSHLFTAVETKRGSGYPKIRGDWQEISKMVDWASSDSIIRVTCQFAWRVAVQGGRRGTPAVSSGGVGNCFGLGVCTGRGQW